ncbi:hypothetical protein DH2020_013357 [Rehmannia glutinosa]|uniref:Reverse transcriptase domain-containing protein n=1 Tax=Rehmannia glutinosa TaxID=99300 RepID=A0ABR0X220_REHGL
MTYIDSKRYFGTNSHERYGLKRAIETQVFFHRKASQRNDRNNIEQIKNSDGLWTTKDIEVAGILKDHFVDLFKSVECTDTHAVLDSVEPKVSRQMNQSLLEPYKEEEIHRALKQMHPLKAPGPDGMCLLFFQKFWNIVSTDFTSTCLNILNNTSDPLSLNHTHIVLIPKVKQPETAKDFRPISLCNVIFRVITKVIANKLKLILPDIILKNQSVFIPGRLITDNAMSAFEIFHSMKKKVKGKCGHFALKLDMSKAYDRVEWPFLEGILDKLGFAKEWIGLVMRCVRLVYSIFINGSPTDCFTPTRGIRQGDPLSPYLFLLCAEGFSSLLGQVLKEMG